MRSVKEIMDAQRFIEKYADTPIGEIDKACAKEILIRSGYLTKTGKVSSKYADLFLNNGDGQPAS